jgi:hypothetical protein
MTTNAQRTVTEERENSTAEGSDLHTVRPEPTSGKELTNRLVGHIIRQEDRIRQKAYDKHNKSEEVSTEVFILCGVVTVTFRVLSLFVVTKCCSYSKIVLQLTVVPPGEYPINLLI